MERQCYGHKQAIGKRGENAAAAYLESLGHEIIERNWRHGHLEIDIITLKGKELHFVEVKSRTAPVAAQPERNVDRKKQKHLCAAALHYVNSAERGHLPENLEIIFDILTVVFYGADFELEYYPHAFIPTYA